MAANITQDLRASARDCKRRADSAHKWALGEAWGPGRSHEAHPRPHNAKFLSKTTQDLREGSRRMNKIKSDRRRAMVAEKLEATDSSADEEIEPVVTNEPDAQVAYSFDANRSPNQGSQVLGVALERAVERFENRETERIVKDEYLVLDSDGEPVAGQSNKAAKPARADRDDEDDFEFV